jgi:O-antigen/teichoic acid export membrane protein
MLNLYTAFANIPNDGLARAMVKEGAQAHQSENETAAQNVVFTSLGLLGSLFVIQWLIALAIALFTTWFEPFQSGGLLFWLLFGFGALSAGYFAGSIFLVWKKTQYQALSATFLSLGGFAGIVLCWSLGFGLQGCLLGFILGQASGGLLMFLINRKHIPIPRFSLSLDPVVSRKLVVFTFAVASTALLNQIGIYGLVHWALDAMGAAKVGLWMAMTRFPDAFNTPILAVANSILLPLLSSHGANTAELRKILRPIFGQSLVWLFVGMGLLFLFYPYLLPLLFSKEFVAETDCVAWQVLGDFFKSSTYMISVLILARGHTRFFFWLESLSVFLLLVLSWLLFERFGFVGMFMTHAIRYFIYWAVLVWNYRSILL